MYTATAYKEERKTGLSVILTNELWADKRYYFHWGYLMKNRTFVIVRKYRRMLPVQLYAKTNIYWYRFPRSYSMTQNCDLTDQVITHAEVKAQWCLTYYYFQYCIVTFGLLLHCIFNKIKAANQPESELSVWFLHVVYLLCFVVSQVKPKLPEHFPEVKLSDHSQNENLKKK